jgi:hypothetical protein
MKESIIKIVGLLEKYNFGDPELLTMEQIDRNNEIDYGLSRITVSYNLFAALWNEFAPEEQQKEFIVECPWCGSTELCCGYPNECSSSLYNTTINGG